MEGPTDDPDIAALRARQQRNLLTTLLLSIGTPMLTAGDESGRTQGGNNNAYCQDNEISWVDWDLDDERRDLLEFTRRLIALRARHPVFRRRLFLTGEASSPAGLPDVWWFRRDGRRMTSHDWESAETRTLGMFLNGEEIRSRGDRGERLVDDSFILLMNAGHEDVDFRMPARRYGRRWVVEIATDAPGNGASGRQRGYGETVPVRARSIVVLRRDL